MTGCTCNVVCTLNKLSSCMGIVCVYDSYLSICDVIYLSVFSRDLHHFGGRERDAGIHHVAQINAGSHTEGLPDRVWYVEHESLDEEDERDPTGSTSPSSSCVTRVPLECSRRYPTCTCS